MLDDLEYITTIDKDGMFDIYRNYISHFREAEKLSLATLEKIKELPSFSKDGITNIVVAGMGGSAISGDILRTIYERKGRAPIIVNRAYTIPGFVDHRSLVIVMSYSGNTEETLAACQAAMKKGARIVAISSGGKLEELSKNPLADEKDIEKAINEILKAINKLCKIKSIDISQIRLDLDKLLVIYEMKYITFVSGG